MLIRYNIDIDAVWNQAGLIYKEKDQNYVLTPYYWNLKDDFKYNHGIQYHRRYYNDVDQYINDLKVILKEGIAVGVSVDISELPYCMYYKGNHDFHIIEVVGLQGEIFIILDHYYHYQGFISIEQLKTSIESYLENINSEYCSLFYIEKREKDEIGLNVPKVNQIMMNNLNIMEGKDIIGLDTKNLILGVNAIPKIQQVVSDTLYLEKSIADQVLDSIFKCVKDVAFSRQNYCNFLAKYTNYSSYTDFEEASQCWTVLANMILRAKVTGEYEGMRKRIGVRFERIIELENRNTSKIREFLMDN